MERAGSILQTNETLDVSTSYLFSLLYPERNFQTTETFQNFILSQTDPQCIQILHPLGLRYFSPTEMLRLFGFIAPLSDSALIWPEDITTKTKYRLIGNSVNVTVVKELLQYLLVQTT